MKRRNEGRAVWSDVVVAICTVGLVYTMTHQPLYTVTTEHDVAVVGIHGPYRFTFQQVDADGDLYGDQFTESICQDYVSPEHDFPLGVIITKLIHTDEGGCWSLNPDKHAGYFKRRDAEKNAEYAKGVQ